MDRPMNEYESALMAALVVLVQAVAKIDKPGLVDHLCSAAKTHADLDNKSGAGILQMLALMAEADPAYVTPPPFTVVRGGKNDTGYSS
jgi:hypothetical protein